MLRCKYNFTVLVIVVAGILFSISLSSFVVNTASSQSLPPYLDIHSATIEELNSAVSIPDRPVALRIEVGGIPNCSDSTNSTLMYGFLIDADKNVTTGTHMSAFDDLGVDARISITCDNNGKLSSSIGTVLTATKGNSTNITILTSVGSLPSADFRWISFAQEGNLFVRVPQDNHHGVFTIHELVNY